MLYETMLQAGPEFDMVAVDCILCPMMHLSCNSRDHVGVGHRAGSEGFSFWQTPYRDFHIGFAVWH
jgi:hypothetical protein